MSDATADDDDLLQRLFAEATVRLEKAHEAAVRGQAPRATADAINSATEDIRAHVDAVNHVIDAIRVLTDVRYRP